MKILAVQNRMGIGDTVIFLPYIKAISQKFKVPVSLLVKSNSKADQFLFQTDYIDKILFLEREKKTDDRHVGFLGSLNLIRDIKKHKFDKIVIFNSSPITVLARPATPSKALGLPARKNAASPTCNPNCCLIASVRSGPIFFANGPAASNPSP